MARAAIRLFPQLKGVRWDFRWAGKVALTADQLPRVHELESGLLACLGYNGRGVALSNAGLVAVHGFADQLDVGHIGQRGADAPSIHRVVIGHEHAYGHRTTSSGSSA